MNDDQISEVFLKALQGEDDSSDAFKLSDTLTMMEGLSEEDGCGQFDAMADKVNSRQVNAKDFGLDGEEEGNDNTMDQLSTAAMLL